MKIPRTRTFTPVTFNDCQLARKPEKNNLIEKISSKRKRYSILNVPKLKVWEIAEEAIIPEETTEKVEIIEENNEKLENDSKEKGVKMSLAKIKKIRRCYRPTFLHNQENLKAELEKFKDKEGNFKPRVLLNDNLKNIAKSDIEQIMESQDYFRSFRGGGKNMKKSSEYLKTDRAVNNSDRNRKYSVGTGSISNQENEFGTPQFTGKKSVKNEGFSERMIFSSCNLIQRTPLPCTKIEKNSEKFKSNPLKSYSVALSQQIVKRIKTQKFHNLL